MKAIEEITANAHEMTIEELQAHKNDRDEVMAGLRAEKKIIHQAFVEKVRVEQQRLEALADPRLNQTLVHGQKNSLTDAIKKFGQDHVFSKLQEMLGEKKEPTDGK